MSFYTPDLVSGVTDYLHLLALQAFAPKMMLLANSKLDS
jgi:hypothetical protein